MFDTAVAHLHLVERSPLGFTPTGFDVFPEMARVYAEMARRLDAEIERRTPDNRFAKSFVPPESSISRLVASLSADTDLGELAALATFGRIETSRLQEMQRQIDELKSKSVTETIRELEETKKDIDGLMDRLADISSALSADRRGEYRVQIASFAEKTRRVAESGFDSFSSGFLRGVGSPEWELFLAAARKLAALEGMGYPQHTDHCLLCHRRLDEDSVVLIQRFWSFLGSEARTQADQAKEELGRCAKELKALKFDFFRADTTARMRVARLNPVAASQIDTHIMVMENDRDTILGVLETGTGELPDAQPAIAGTLAEINEQVDVDIQRLQRQDVSETLRDLETERVILRHRRVLNQLFSEIETYVANSA